MATHAPQAKQGKCHQGAVKKPAFAKRKEAIPQLRVGKKEAFFPVRIDQPVTGVVMPEKELGQDRKAGSHDQEKPLLDRGQSAFGQLPSQENQDEDQVDRPDKHHQACGKTHPR